jgi:hypothetical protein
MKKNICHQSKIERQHPIPTTSPYYLLPSFLFNGKTYNDPENNTIPANHNACVEDLMESPNANKAK